MSQHVTSVTKHLWGCFWWNSSARLLCCQCDPPGSVVLLAGQWDAPGTVCPPGQNCSTLNLRVLQGSGFRKVWRAFHPLSVNISIQSSFVDFSGLILPYYAGSTAILWQLFLHDTLFLWTDQAKLQTNKEGTVLSPTHQFNFSYFPFLAEPQSRTTCLWQASPKGRLENNFHQLSAFSIFRERTCHWPSWVGDSVWEIDKLLWHCHSAIVPTQRPLKVQRVWVLKCRQETPCPDLLGTKCQGSVWYSGGFILHF